MGLLSMAKHFFSSDRLLDKSAPHVATPVLSPNSPPAALADSDTTMSESAALDTILLPPQAATRPATTTTRRTPVSSKLEPYRELQRRFDLRLSLPPSDEPEATLVAALARFFARLQTVDPSAIVYGWSDGIIATTPSLTAPNRLPHTVGVLRKYLPRAFPKRPGGNLYTPVRLGFSLPWEDIMEEMG